MNRFNSHKNETTKEEIEARALHLQRQDALPIARHDATAPMQLRSADIPHRHAGGCRAESQTRGAEIPIQRREPRTTEKAASAQLQYRRITRRRGMGGRKMSPFTMLAIVFIVSLPTGAYLVTNDHGILGAICIICPFCISVSRTTVKEERK